MEIEKLGLSHHESHTASSLSSFKGKQDKEKKVEIEPQVELSLPKVEELSKIEEVKMELKVEDSSPQVFEEVEVQNSVVEESTKKEKGFRKKKKD
jgi:hypothetical protein